MVKYGLNGLVYGLKILNLRLKCTKLLCQSNIFPIFALDN